MGKFRAPAPASAPEKTQLRSAPAPGPCIKVQTGFEKFDLRHEEKVGRKLHASNVNNFYFN